MNILKRDEIIGAKITAVYQTEWQKIDGVQACAVYVELDSGLLFEIGYLEPGELGIPIARIDAAKLNPAEYPVKMRGCVGESIVQVVYSDYWPTIGLKLSSGRFLTCRDRGTPFCIGAYIYEPSLSDIKDVVDFFEPSGRGQV